MWPGGSSQNKGGAPRLKEISPKARDQNRFRNEIDSIVPSFKDFFLVFALEKKKDLSCYLEPVTTRPPLSVV